MSLFIRESAEADLPRILAVYRSSGIDDREYPADGEIRAIYGRMKGYPNYRVFVAEIDGEIRGTFALLIMDNLAHGGKPSALLEDVAVSAESQGQGIGKAMMAFAMEECRRFGCYKLALSSNEKRKDAHRFYENLGFRRHGISFLIDT